MAFLNSGTSRWRSSESNHLLFTNTSNLDFKQKQYLSFAVLISSELLDDLIISMFLPYMMTLIQNLQNFNFCFFPKTGRTKRSI